MTQDNRGDGQLKVDDLVRYTAEPRPNLICPHCEVSSVAIGESETLRTVDGQVGAVVDILDPHSMDDEKTVCAHCQGEWLLPEHFREMGIVVIFSYPVIPGQATGVYAFPSELELISQEEWEAARPKAWRRRKLLVNARAIYDLVRGRRGA